MTSKIDLSSEIEAIFGCDRPFAVLLRPDNYIALLSTDLPIRDLESYFIANILSTGDRANRELSQKDLGVTSNYFFYFS